jgi:hypothetical protein
MRTTDSIIKKGVEVNSVDETKNVLNDFIRKGKEIPEGKLLDSLLRFTGRINSKNPYVLMTGLLGKERKIAGEIKSVDNEVNKVTGISSEIPQNPVEAEIYKKAKLAAEETIKRENIEAVRKSETIKSKEEFEINLRDKNPNISEELVITANEKFDLMTNIYDGGLENEAELSGLRSDIKSDIEGMVGILKKSPDKIKKTQLKNQELNTKLNKAGVILPRNLNLETFEAMMGSLDQPQKVDRLFSSTKGDRTWVERMVTKRQNKPVVMMTNNFVSKIGNQPVNYFIKKTANLFEQYGLRGGMESIMMGFGGGGNDNKIEIPGINGESMATAIKPVMNTIGGGFEKNLGGLINSGLNLGSSFLKKSGLGGLLGAGGGAGAAGTAAAGGAAVAGGAAAVGGTAAAPYVVGVVVLIAIMFIIPMFLQTTFLSSQVSDSVIAENTSSLYPSSEQSNLSLPSSDGLVVENAKCSVVNKTVATSQCSSENRSTYLDKVNCPRTDRSTYSRTICSSGCGLISTSIILQAHDPIMTAKYVYQNTNFRKNGQDICLGIGWSHIRKTIIDFLGENSAETVNFNCDKQYVLDKICAGYVVIVNFQFYNSSNVRVGGHYAVAVATTNDNDFVIKSGVLQSFNEYYKSGVSQNKIPKINACLAVKADSI